MCRIQIFFRNYNSKLCLGIDFPYSRFYLKTNKRQWQEIMLCLKGPEQKRKFFINKFYLNTAQGKTKKTKKQDAVGSEFQTCLVLKWAKPVRSLDGSVFEWHTKGALIQGWCINRQSLIKKPLSKNTSSNKSFLKCFVTA